MKHLLLTLSLFVSLFTFGQPNEQLKSRIKAQKVAFITERLNLTSTEAQKFWPIYNSFEETSENIRHNELRRIKQKLRDNPNLSNSQADALLTQLISAEDKLHKTRQKLFSDLRNVISSIKILQLKRAEDAFNRKLLAKLKEYRGHGVEEE